jgi:type II secretory pathway pseudopilin PulG
LTLLEIMIVVGIVGILAGMAAMSITGPRRAAQTNTCIANLRQLENAKQEWAFEKNKTGGDTPTLAEIKPYFRFSPDCPALGSYTINAVSNKATCSITGHSL